MTQNEMILAYLEKYGSITQAEAMASIGCYRLGARIWDLRHDGHRISAELESGTNRHGEPVKYARYTLMEG